MSFWGSLFGGSNPTLSKDMSQFGQVGGFATGLGEANLAKSSQFYSNLLSGDPSQVAKSLGPEIKGVQDQKQQQLNTNAQFGNRSGGTNASNQMASDNARSSINGMTSSLLNSSAGALGSMGSNLLSQGTSALNDQLNASQLQMQNWNDSLFGKGITSAAAAGESFALGKM